MTNRRLAVALLVLLAACGHPRAPTTLGLPYSPYAHEHEPFARQMFNEQSSIPQAPDPELMWVARDYAARYTHLSGGVRRSSPGRGPAVWFFGGSTLFGIGQRDDRTIPSDISRLAAAAHTPVTVYNFGFPGYLSWQEAALMRRELAQRPAPDLIVFYDGVNDLGAICRQMALGLRPDGLGNPLATPEPAHPKETCVSEPAKAGGLVAAAVARSMTQARQAAAGIPVLQFWQPYASTQRHADPGLLVRLQSTEADRVLNARISRAAYDRLTPKPIDLTDALDGIGAPVYFDWAHTNELGAEAVARAMWDRGLREALAQLPVP